MYNCASCYPNHVNNSPSNNYSIDVQSPVQNNFKYPQTIDNKLLISENYALTTPKKPSRSPCLEMFTPIKNIRHNNKSKRRNVSPADFVNETAGEPQTNWCSSNINSDLVPKLGEHFTKKFEPKDEFDSLVNTLQIEFNDYFTSTSIFSHICENPEKLNNKEKDILNQINKTISNINFYKDYEKNIQIILIGNDLSFNELPKSMFFQNLGNLQIKEGTLIAQGNQFFINGIASIFASIANNEFVNYNCRLIFICKDLNQIILEKIELQSF